VSVSGFSSLDSIGPVGSVDSLGSVGSVSGSSRVERRSDDETPGTVTAAVAASVAPLPFLAFYAAIFLARGTVFPANQPDVTSSRGGEALAGVGALLLLVFLTVGSYRFHAGRGRLAYLVGQGIVLGWVCYFLATPSSGGLQVALLVLVTTVVALALAFVGPSRSWVDDRLGRLRPPAVRLRAGRRETRGRHSQPGGEPLPVIGDAAGPGLSPGTVSAGESDAPASIA
jgi:hypothetical protein